MKESEWERFWTWFKKNFRDEDGATYYEIFEDLRQLYEGKKSLPDIGISRVFLDREFILSTRE